MTNKKLSTQNKDIECSICKLVINQDKEFCKFIQFVSKDKILSEKYYHVNCFGEKLRGSSELKSLQAKLNNLMALAEQRLV